jgi:hypothetical protein
VTPRLKSDNHMRRAPILPWVASLVACIVSDSAIAQTPQVCAFLAGAKLVAQDDSNTYLGKIANSYDKDSIFNEYGTYGSKYSAKSIWNEYGTFGSEYSLESPFNKYSTMPPMIIKDGEVVGYLSANKSLEASIAPGLLKALCEDEL